MEIDKTQKNFDIDIDLVMKKLDALQHRESSEISSIREKVESEAAKKDIYDGLADRYIYKEPRSYPSRDTHNDSLYREFIRSEVLVQYFPKLLFDQIYNLCRETIREYRAENSISYITLDEVGSFSPLSYSYDFRLRMINLMKLYVIYKEEFKMENEMTFEDFIKNDIYGKQQRKERREAFEKARDEFQKNFVYKNDNELRDLYNEDKSFIEHMYYRYVDSIDCTDIIPFGEFLKLYDLADRNYRCISAYIDHRLLTEVVEKYYKTFTQVLNCQDTVDISKFWEIFNKCIDNEDKKEFKNNVVNEIQQYIESLNINLDSLYSRKK